MSAKVLFDIIDRTFSVDSEVLPSLSEIKESVLLDEDWNNPDRYPGNDSYLFRDKYVKHSFPILSDDMIRSMADFLSKREFVVELACGEGWLTYWLNKYCPDTVLECVDNMTWPKHKDHLDIVKSDCAIEYAKDNSDVDLYIFSWPYMDDVAYKVWNEMRKGQELLYIGESWGGCTADDSFFEAVNGFEVKHEIESFVSFCGIHDYVYLYRKG
jgi:hypothetical protein